MHVDISREEMAIRAEQHVERLKAGASIRLLKMSQEEYDEAGKRAEKLAAKLRRTATRAAERSVNR